MKPLQTSNLVPAWQIEHANKVHRACLRVQRAIGRGQRIQKSINRVARSLHGRPFKCEPTRRLVLTAGVLRRMWDIWKRDGQVPAAVRLKYRGRIPYIPRQLLMRFAQFCAATRLPSVRLAWLKFSARPQNKRAKEFSYGQVTYVFSADDFYLMQKQLKAIEAAQTNLDYLLSKVAADITNRLREHPPRQRIKPGTGYEI